MSCQPDKICRSAYRKQLLPAGQHSQKQPGQIAQPGESGKQQNEPFDQPDKTVFSGSGLRLLVRPCGRFVQGLFRGVDIETVVDHETSSFLENSDNSPYQYEPV